MRLRGFSRQSGRPQMPLNHSKIIKVLCVSDRHGRLSWYDSVVPRVAGCRITAGEVNAVLSPKRTYTCIHVHVEQAGN